MVRFKEVLYSIICNSVILIIVFQLGLLHAQKTEYSLFSISDELKEGANSVVRSSHTDIEIKGQSKMITTTTRVVTVLNKLGYENLNASYYYDKSTKIKFLEAEVYNALGVQVARIKKKNFDESKVRNRYPELNNDKALVLNYFPIGYPFTVVLHSKIETKNTAGIPSWSVVNNYNESVEQISLEVRSSPGLGLKWYENNYSDTYDIEKQTDSLLVKYTAKNIAAITNEFLTPSISKLVPRVEFSLEKFHLDGFDGQAKDWKEFGLWYNNSILKGSNRVSKHTRETVENLVESVTSPLEKAKLVYQFVIEKYKYVSIPLGAGGWKPMSVKDMDRLGYGDCKGIVNYTKSLLDLVGVPSNYVVVYAGRDDKKDIQSERVYMQGNHVILNLPIENKNYWLEFTSQRYPFAYQDSYSDGRAVLVFKPEGAEVIKTDSFKSLENKISTAGEYRLSDSGDISVAVQIVSEGTKYDLKHALKRLKSEKRLKHYTTRFDNLHNIALEEVIFEDNKDAYQFSESIKMEAKRYAKLKYGKLVLSLNAFSRNDMIFKKYRKRKNSFEILRGSYFVDDITVYLPDGHKLETNPEGQELVNKFGSYKTEITVVSEGVISYKREFILNEGIYEKTEYADFRFFLEQVTRYDASKVVLVK